MRIIWTCSLTTEEGDVLERQDQCLQRVPEGTATHHDTVGGQQLCAPCAKDLALERMVNVGEIENVGQQQEPAPAATDASRTTSPGPPASAASTPGPRGSSPN